MTVVYILIFIFITVVPAVLENKFKANKPVVRRPQGQNSVPMQNANTQNRSRDHKSLTQKKARNTVLSPKPAKNISTPSKGTDILQTAQESYIPEEGICSIEHNQVSDNRKVERKKRIELDPTNLVIYSAIMQPKFSEESSNLI